MAQRNHGPGSVVLRKRSVRCGTPWRRRWRIRREPLNDLLWHPPCVDEEPEAVVSFQASGDDASSAGELDAPAARGAHHGLPTPQAGVSLIVKRTPGPRVFMTFPEGLTSHLQAIQTTVAWGPARAPRFPRRARGMCDRGDGRPGRAPTPGPSPGP